MTLLLGIGCVVVGLVVVLACLSARETRQERYVSAAWRAEIERRESRQGIDGVCWQWPVNKPMDKAGWFNRYRYRKGA